MKSKFLTASLLASALFAGVGMSPAMAQGTNTPRIDQAQQAISARIQQGLASGQITPSEAQVLYRRDREIQMRENQYKAYGNVHPQQRQQLRDDLSALGADVERMMNNRDVVRPAGNAAQREPSPAQAAASNTGRATDTAAKCFMPLPRQQTTAPSVPAEQKR